VLGFRLGPAGWFAAQLLGSVVALPLAIKEVRDVWRPTFDTTSIVRALRFGLPLVPHHLSHWVLTLADRAVLSLFVSTALVGVYSLGYQIVAVLGLVINSLNQSLMPEYARGDARNETGVRVEHVVTMQVLLTAYLGVAAALMIPVIINGFLPREYHGAGPLIPWLVLGYVMYGLYLIPMNLLTLVRGDTKWIWVITATTGAINVALNFALIPFWGIVAPAVVTAISYSLLFILIMAYGGMKFGVLIQYEYQRMLWGLAIMAAGYIAAVYSSASSTLGSLPVRLAWCLVIGIAVLLLSGVQQSLDVHKLYERHRTRV
jgi:O-antigen/teichoic acid export membrane protein